MNRVVIVGGMDEITKALNQNVRHGDTEGAEDMFRLILRHVSGVLKRYERFIDRDALLRVLWSAAVEYGDATFHDISFAEYLICQIEKAGNRRHEAEELESLAYSGNSLQAYKRRTFTARPEDIVIQIHDKGLSCIE